MSNVPVFIDLGRLIQINLDIYEGLLKLLGTFDRKSTEEMIEKNRIDLIRVGESLMIVRILTYSRVYHWDWAEKKFISTPQLEKAAKSIPIDNPLRDVIFSDKESLMT